YSQENFQFDRIRDLTSYRWTYMLLTFHMKDALMERLEIFLHRKDNSTVVGIPASQEEIAEAQQRLLAHILCI
ncbi:putative cell wall assembly protein, partial [Paenibacillus agaridevorans]